MTSLNITSQTEDLVMDFKCKQDGTSKVGAISKAQKAQKTFFEKKRIFLIFFLSENVA